MQTGRLDTDGPLTLFSPSLPPGDNNKCLLFYGGPERAEEVMEKQQLTSDLSVVRERAKAPFLNLTA